MKHNSYFETRISTKNYTSQFKYGDDNSNKVCVLTGRDKIVKTHGVEAV